MTYDRFSPMIRRLKPSSTLAVLDASRRLEQQGKHIIHLELGEPDIPSPPSVKQAIQQALAEDFTQYTVSRGILPLRQAIAQYYSDQFGVNNVDPATQVIATPGGKSAIFYTILQLVAEGDEVIIPTPAWVSYASLVEFAGGTPVYVDAYCEEGGVDVDRLRQAITDRTKLLILNYPTNPTSRVISDEKYRELANLVAEHPNLMLMSDEIYSELAYKGLSPSFLSFPSIRDQLILVSGFSKSHSMTGYRLGYAVAPEEFVAKMAALQSNSSTCPASFVQKAGIAALGDREHVQRARRIFEERASLVTDLMAEIPGVHLDPPEAAFYAFPRIEGAKKDFAVQLLEQGGVAGTPGCAFGPPCEEHIRLSFATSEDNIREGLKRLKTFVVSYRG